MVSFSSGLQSKKLLSVLYFLALFFMTATSLRGGGVPIGVSELLGMLSILIGVVQIFRRSALLFSERCFALFLVFLLLVELIGLLHSVYILGDVGEPWHDLFGLFYALMFSFVLLASFPDQRKIVTILALSFAGSAIVLMMIFMLSLKFSLPFEVWHERTGEVSSLFQYRYMGWSQNPNQLGIFFVCAPFFILAAMRCCAGFSYRLMLLSGLVCVAFLAILFRSTTVFIAWAICSSILLGFRVSKSSAYVQCFAIAISSLALIGILTFVDVFEFVLHVFDKGDSGGANGRTDLWKTAIDVISQSPIFGFGPGTHSGEVPFGGVEAHMLILDLGMQGGLIFMTTLLVVIFSSLYLSRAYGIYIFLAVLACFVEQIAHNVSRYPVFWIVVLMPYFVRSSCAKREHNVKILNSPV